MAQKREQVRKKRETVKTEGTSKTAKGSSKTSKEEILKRADAILEAVDALLKEYASGSRPKKAGTEASRRASPHVHLCDGTKIDLRKLFK